MRVEIGAGVGQGSTGVEHVLANRQQVAWWDAERERDGGEGGYGAVPGDGGRGEEGKEGLSAVNAGWTQQ